MRREFSTGGIVFKRIKTEKDSKEVIWLLAKSAVSELFPISYWRLPKGWIDDMEDGQNPGPLARGKRRATEKELQEAALREVREEAGVTANIIKKIGTGSYTYTFQNKRIMKFVTFYLMEWTKDLPEGFGFETSETGWFSFEEARKLLKSSNEKKMLDKAKKMI